MKLHQSNLVVSMFVGLALGACTTLGTGAGTTLPGEQPVSFTWKSSDGGVTGTMSAMVSGAAYTGQYRELTNTVQSAEFFPVWLGSVEPGWGWQPVSTTSYSGKVVANLQGPEAQRMRCDFNLADPKAGMRAGGQGQCRLAGGATVDATFPRA